MTQIEALIKEAESTSPDVIAATLDFILFLKTKQERKNYDALLLGYSTLAKDWFSPEEEEAWKDLQ